MCSMGVAAHSTFRPRGTPVRQGYRMAQSPAIASPPICLLENGFGDPRMRSEGNHTVARPGLAKTRGLR